MNNGLSFDLKDTEEKDMTRLSRNFIYILSILSVLLMSAMGTSTALADDGTSNDPPPSQPAPPPPESSGETTDTCTASSEAAVEPAPTPDDQVPVPAEEVTVSEVLDQAPDGTGLVILNEGGAAEPLASQEAVEIVANSDPIWCPEGQVPTAGLNGCTPSYTTFDSLITELTTNATYSGNGVIWVEGSYAGADDSPILFDGSSGNLAFLSDITMKGGWAGSSGSTVTDPSSPSLFDVPLSFTNWIGNIYLLNLEFQNANSGTASLAVETDGDISLTNVGVTGNPSGTGALLDNCLNSGAGCTASGDITVMGSEFSSNAGNGLSTESSGNVTVKDVTASSNTSVGIHLNTDNGNNNDVKLTDVAVDGNGNDGIHIYDVDGDITLSDITATNNNDGIEIDDSYGNVSGYRITASSNSADGVDIANTNGSLVLSGVTASQNMGNGFEINFVDGDLKLYCVTTNENTGDGMYLNTNGGVTIKCSTANDNHDDGVDINLAPTAQLLSLTTSGNIDQDVEYDPLVTTLTIKKIDCSPKKSKPTNKPVESSLYTKLFCLPGEITASLYATYGNQVEFNNLCGYEAGIFDQGSGAYPKAIPGGDEYITSLYEKVLQDLPNSQPDDEHGIPGMYAVVIDDLPYILPEGYQYASAFFTVVLEEGEVLDPLPEDAALTIRFLIPEGLDEDEELTILWWDGTEWQDLGGEISEDGLYFQVTTSEIGIFALTIH
jgi:hypothetical protein